MHARLRTGHVTAAERLGERRQKRLFAKAQRKVDRALRASGSGDQEWS
jgi:hypothetical protein